MRQGWEMDGLCKVVVLPKGESFTASGFQKSPTYERQGITRRVWIIAPIPRHFFFFKCHMSFVMGHLPCVGCHLSPVICHSPQSQPQTLPLLTPNSCNAQQDILLIFKHSLFFFKLWFFNFSEQNINETLPDHVSVYWESF